MFLVGTAMMPMTTTSKHVAIGVVMHKAAFISAAIRPVEARKS